jgi:hypothetical protein
MQEQLSEGKKSIWLKWTLRIAGFPATIRVEDTSSKTLKEFRLNWFSRAIARICFGPLLPNRRLFYLQLDPYERSARFVNTHVLAQYLSLPSVLDALKAGRAFVGFDMIADSSGFRWIANAGTNQIVMGEAGTFSEGIRGCMRPLLFPIESRRSSEFLTIGSLGSMRTPSNCAKPPRFAAHRSARSSAILRINSSK